MYTRPIASSSGPAVPAERNSAVREPVDWAIAGYCGYHYGVDSLAGIVFGATLAGIAIRISASNKNAKPRTS